MQNATNTLINAGTGAGVALSGPVALVLGDQWRYAFAGFALAAFGVALTLPRRSPDATATAQAMPSLDGTLQRLILAAFLALAIGQTAGAPGFGLLMDRLTAGHAVILFACLGLAAGLPHAGHPAGCCT